MDPLQEGGGLATLPKHLPGLVRHGAGGWPVQRCHHGPVRVRHPALRLRAARRANSRDERDREEEEEETHSRRADEEKRDDEVTEHNEMTKGQTGEAWLFCGFDRGWSHAIFGSFLSSSYEF